MFTIWIERLLISERVAPKIIEAHGIDPGEVRAAVERVEGLDFSWVYEPERGRHDPYVIVRTKIQAKDALAVLYPTDDPADNGWRLASGDGAVVHVPSPAGTQALEFGGGLEVGRPAGIPEGSEIDASFVVALQAVPLTPGQRFTWRLSVSNRELATEGFYVRPLPRQPTPSPPESDT